MLQLGLRAEFIPKSERFEKIRRGIHPRVAQLLAREAQRGQCLYLRLLCVTEKVGKVDNAGGIRIRKGYA